MQVQNCHVGELGQKGHAIEKGPLQECPAMWKGPLQVHYAQSPDHIAWTACHLQLKQWSTTWATVSVCGCIARQNWQHLLHAHVSLGHALPVSGSSQQSFCILRSCAYVQILDAWCYQHKASWCTLTVKRINTSARPTAHGLLSASWHASDTSQWAAFRIKACNDVWAVLAWRPQSYDPDFRKHDALVNNIPGTCKKDTLV